MIESRYQIQYEKGTEFKRGGTKRLIADSVSGLKCSPLPLTFLYSWNWKSGKINRFKLSDFRRSLFETIETEQNGLGETQ